MKYCNQCGAEVEDDAAFCQSCGVALAAGAVDTEQPTQATEPTDTQAEKPVEKSKGGFIGKVNRAAEKTAEFEKKHSIILNAIIMACAIVIIFVALFAPIKVTYYYNPLTETDGDETSYSYTEIDQSIFQMIGAVTYFNASDETKAELIEEIEKAEENATKEFAKWALSHLDATEEEAYNARKECYAEALSDVNYLGYTIAMSDLDDMINGTFIDAVISAVFGIIIAVLAIVMAIISLVHIIFAIINMVKKKPQTKLYKYLTSMLAISVYGLTLMFCTPLFKAGGNMFAIALFTAIVFLICAGVGGLLANKEHKLVVLKRSIIALVSMVSFFILCSDVFAITDSATKTTVYGTTGHGLHSMLGTLQFGEGAPDMKTLLANSLIGVIMYILVAGIVVSYIAQVMRRAFRRLAFGDVKKSSITGYSIASAIFALIAIILGFMSNTLTSSFFSMFDLGKIEITVKWLMRAQIWVAMFFMIAVAVFNKVFLPDDLAGTPAAKAAEEPQKPEQPQEQTDLI